MKEGPDIARLGSLVGDPGRANMLLALIGGRALTATELAAEAGVTLPTASSHLGKLADGGLIVQRRQGRHRYYTLADAGVGGMLESMMGLAARKGHVRLRTGPRDPALRRARVCYDHLAGAFGVRIYDRLVQDDCLELGADDVGLTSAGRQFVADFGIDLAALEAGRRPLCRNCLDWSARRSHLAGAVGAALLDRMMALGWARRRSGTRVIDFGPAGEAAFRSRFGDPGDD